MDYRVPTPLECALRRLTDGEILGPLWDWAPDVRSAVLHERRVRGLVRDDEPAGDPDYS